MKESASIKAFRVLSLLVFLAPFGIVLQAFLTIPSSNVYLYKEAVTCGKLMFAVSSFQIATIMVRMLKIPKECFYSLLYKWLPIDYQSETNRIYLHLILPLGVITITGFCISECINGLILTSLLTVFITLWINMAYKQGQHDEMIQTFKKKIQK